MDSPPNEKEPENRPLAPGSSQRLPDGLAQEEQREYGSAGFADGKCGGQAGFAEQPVQQEHHRDIAYKLPDNRMQHRPLSVSHSLHAEGRVIVDELEWRGKSVFL